MAAVIRLCLSWMLPLGRHRGAHGTPGRSVSYWIPSDLAISHGNVRLLLLRLHTRYETGGPYLTEIFADLSSLSAAVVCIIWYGIQTFYAGNILSVMLRCIFGSSWDNLANTLPASGNVTSKQLLAFFMAWLMQFPLVSLSTMPPYAVETDHVCRFGFILAACAGSSL